jgi:hypothetical protein
MQQPVCSTFERTAPGLLMMKIDKQSDLSVRFNFRSIYEIPRITSQLMRQHLENT